MVFFVPPQSRVMRVGAMASTILKRFAAALRPMTEVQKSSSAGPPVIKKHLTPKVMKPKSVSGEHPPPTDPTAPAPAGSADSTLDDMGRVPFAILDWP